MSMRDSKWSPAIPQKRIFPTNTWRTCSSLRLNVAAAMEGQTWLLLPEGFRDQECGELYPLPSDRLSLQQLASIPVPRNKKDSGCLYLKRVLKVYKRRQAHKQSAVLDVARREVAIGRAQENFSARLQGLRAEVTAAVEGVKQEVERATASLNTLFTLGRQGIEGQMKAHLEGALWQGEGITASAFRECFRMVTQAVKGLGLPSEQRNHAAEAVMEEVAASLRDTQETVALASNPEKSEVEH